MTEAGRKAIQERARELGFDACRFTTASPPDHAAEFQRWLAAGRHGEMGYLQRNAGKRIDPSLVLADARTIITLAVSYNVDLPAPAPQTSATGQIARYAQFSDYHDVLGERLKTLARFIDQLGAGDLAGCGRFRRRRSSPHYS